MAASWQQQNMIAIVSLDCCDFSDPAPAPLIRNIRGEFGGNVFMAAVAVSSAAKTAEINGFYVQS